METSSSEHGQGLDSDPDTEEDHEQLCTPFADITGSDVALARFYLQRNGWRLQDAINDYFESNQDDTSTGEDQTTGVSPAAQAAASTSVSTSRAESHDAPASSKQHLGPTGQEMSSTGSEQAAKYSSNQSTGRIGFHENLRPKWLIWRSTAGYIGTPKAATLDAPTSSEQHLDPTGPVMSLAGSEHAAETSNNQSAPVTAGLMLLTWNIDGLDERNILERTKAVCNIINSLYPDVVFLQEVIPQTFAYIEAKCDRYKSIASGTGQYFTAMLLRKSSITFSSQNIHPFPTTQMMRNLLVVKARFGSVPLCLMTTHLESTKDHAAERKRQLQQVLRDVTQQDQSNTVIVGGDLNLRDAEVASVGGLPAGTVDFWEACGSPPQHKFTWDLTKNDNLDWQFKFRPKCRFDRVFVRASQPEVQLCPETIRFMGTDRLAGCGRYPSDHWGLLCKFSKLCQVQKQVVQADVSSNETGRQVKRLKTT